MTDDIADLVSKALRRAWQLGQTYWQQADSEYVSESKKADATQDMFNQLVEATRAAILTANSSAQPAPDDEYVGWYCAHCLRGVDASEVTYHEQHEACGRVITDDRPPKSAPIIPEGWKLVPIEPTPEMVEAASGYHSLAMAWRAAINVAPEAKP